MAVVVATVVLAACAAVLYRRMDPDDPGRDDPGRDDPGRDDPGRDDPGRDQNQTPREPALLSALAAWQPHRPTTRAGRLAAYLWAAPLSFVGLLLGTSGRASLSVRDGVVLCTGTRGPVGTILRRRGFHATTLGHVVVTTSPQPSEPLIAHELLHTRQAERMGVLFGPIYVALLARYGYRRHPMERAARRAADL